MVNSQKSNLERELARKIYATPCEKAKICPSASEACYEALPYESEWRTIPARRWIDCYAYKQMLGLEFIKELGIYHLTNCPKCGADLVAEVRRNAKAYK